MLIQWSYSSTQEPVDGYYVSVQEVLNKKRLGSPDFVHIEPDVHTAEIQGLKPDAVYEMKVQLLLKHSLHTKLLVHIVI